MSSFHSRFLDYDKLYSTIALNVRSFQMHILSTKNHAKRILRNDGHLDSSIFIELYYVM